MRRILLWAALVALIFTATASATKRYVSQTSGNDGNAGTISSPYQTLGKLESVMANNDTGYITGTFNESTSGGDHLYGDYYRGNLYFDGLNGWLIAQWPDSTRPRLYGNKPGSCSWPPSCGNVQGFDGTGIDVYQCDNWEIRNLDFRFCARGIFMDNCTTWTVRGCTFDSIFAGSSHVVGNGCRGSYCNFGAVFPGYIGSGHGMTLGRITNCIFGADIYDACGTNGPFNHDTDPAECLCGWAGPWTLSSGGQNGGAIFTYRMVSNRIDSCTFLCAYTQIYLKGEAHYNTAEYNTHMGARGHGAFFSSSGIHDTVRNNLYVDCNPAVEPWSYVGSSTYCDTPYIYNNTFYLCPTDIELSNDGKIVRSMVVFNNIFAKFTNRALDHGGDAPVNGNTIELWDYNAYDNTTGSTKFTFNSTNYTLSTWKSSLGWEGHEVNASPDFFVDTTAAGGRDFRLNPGGASYATLATGGRGGRWPRYFGAINPASPGTPAVLPPLPLRKRARK